jgi:hypothetical protein
MLLGIWYLPLPLGGYYWWAYFLGIGIALVCGIWARRTFRVQVIGHDAQGTLLRVERIRPKAKRRTRKALRLAILAVVGFFALTALTNQFLVKPRAGVRRHTGAPPTLSDWRPLPSIDGPSGESRIEPKLTHVAAVISGYGTEVRCWSVEDWRQLEDEWGDWKGRPLGEWGAYTTPRRPSLPNAYRIQLSPSICATLARLVYEDVPAQQDPWPEALAWSVAALAHESQHVRGIFDEAVAECYGVQAIAATTVALGRTGSEGRFVASLYWRNAYLRQDEPAYRSEECRDGGGLDLRPESNTWP